MVRKTLFTFLAITIMAGFSLAVKVPRCAGQEGYVGAGICRECHKGQYRSLVQSRHGVKGDPRTPVARRDIHVCESCHGPGRAHVFEGGGKGKGSLLTLRAKSPEPSEKKNAVCLTCHARGRQTLWHGSEHENRNLACANCHSIHQGFPHNLAKPAETEVCTQCHKRIRSELLRQSHHPIREHKIKCTDCHNPHGTIAEKLVTAEYVNLKCFECHANLRGPFLWDHPPVIEDCITCHTPHGSVHRALLRTKVPYLCQRCHSNVGHASQLYARSTNQSGQSVYRVLNNRAFYRGCLNCHISIHGSNHPSGKGWLR